MMQVWNENTPVEARFSIQVLTLENLEMILEALRYRGHVEVHCERGGPQAVPSLAELALAATAKHAAKDTLESRVINLEIALKQILDIQAWNSIRPK